MTETWKPYPANPEYEVSSHGRVKRLAKDAPRLRQERILSQSVGTTGYCQANVRVDGLHRPRKVHLLVAETFLGDRAGKVVNHLDGNKLNNRADNLELTTRAGNVAHAVAHGLLRSGSDHWNVKLTDDDVREIRRMFRAGLSGREIAGRFGITRSYAYHIKQRIERAAA